MASTPSRSRQAMRISLPFMPGPISARFRAGDFFVVSKVLLMFFYGCDWPPWIITKNPRPLPAVGFCRNSVSVSTVPGGIDAYQRDGYYNQDMSNVFHHLPYRSQPPETGQAQNQL